MLSCRFCNRLFQQLSDYINHQKHHWALSKKLYCGFKGCNRKYEHETSLRKHLKNHHQFGARFNEPQKSSGHFSLANSNSKYVCTNDLCKKEICSYNDFKKHLNQHLNRNEVITCPFKNCVKKYNVNVSYRVHVTRYHKNRILKLEESEPFGDGDANTELMQQQDKISECNFDFSNNCNQNFDEENKFSERENKSSNSQDTKESKKNSFSESFKDVFVANMAQFYLKLETQFLTPISTIQFIAETLQHVHSQTLDFMKRELIDSLAEENLINDKISDIINIVFNNNLLSKAGHILKSDHLRKEYYKKKFVYVAPKMINLGKINGKARHFHYVSIIDSIKAAFKDKSLDINMITPENKTPDVLKEFYDGRVFKNNPLFRDNLETLKIILYQDAFEIVNPIGASKGKHKMLGIYFTLANYPYHIRTRISNIKLVALCNEKYFSHEAVFRVLVDELKIIESGIEVYPGKIVKGGVAFITGDNLGSHTLGGFIENFSFSHYFCRFCTISRQDFILEQRENICEVASEHDDSDAADDEGQTETESDNEEEFDEKKSDDETEMEVEVDTGERIPEECVNNNLSADLYDELISDLSSDDDVSDENDAEDGLNCDRLECVYNNNRIRDVKSYKNAITKLAEMEKESNDSKGKNKTKKKRKKVNSYEGIKFNSIFNELQNYHVCSPGLPSCIAHDAFEGFINYDLFLAISSLVQKNWFSVDYLNNRIETHKYSQRDLRDKPSKINISGKNKKLVGGAWQIYTLLMLLPLFIGDKVQDFEDDVWIFLVTMTELVEIVCAPEIHISNISYLSYLIEEYISLRINLFPDVKIRPKHHYMTHYPDMILDFGPLIKVCTLRFESKHTYFKRAMRNLKCYKNVTLSLCEKHELYQCLLRAGVGYDGNMEVKEEIELDLNSYSSSIQSAIQKAQVGHVTDCASVIYKGTHYKKGDIVIVRQNQYRHEVEMGRITTILCSDEQILYVVAEILNTYFRPCLMFYELKEPIRYQCVKIDELLTYETHQQYEKNPNIIVKLRHGLVSNPILYQ